MPVLTRWTIRTAMIYLIAGLAAGVLYWANVQWQIAPIFGAFSPTYLHMLVIGWLTQLIFGVIYWMFPIIRKDNMRGDPRLAWAVYGLLNVGLLVRVVCEPWRGLDPNDVNGIGLVVAAVLQVAAGYLFIVVCWPRVRERAGTGTA
ncbi:MAG: DUF2871 family protein [Anaerolineae bacterium]|nr:DUF2871 family protein [Anaerolineae bacterium]